MTKSDGSHGYIPPRVRALAVALRRAREQNGMPMRELAKRLSMSHSKISDIENGKIIPNRETTGLILGQLQTPPEDRDRIFEMLRKVGEPNWLTVGYPGITEQLVNAVDHEKDAKAITEWSSIVIPGLLQTAEYARALAESPCVQVNEVEPRLIFRAGRSEVLTRHRDPVRFHAMIGETALRVPVGSREIMIEQLRHLIAMCERPNIDVQIVSSLVGPHPGWAGPFVLYDFQDGPSVLYFEHYSSGAFVPNGDNVQAYRKAIEIMSNKVAYNSIESIQLINQIIKEWSTGVTDLD